MMVSIFKNFIEVVEQQPITSILADIKNGKYKNAITYLRKSLAENKSHAYDKGKKSLLAFTPSATFIGGRKLEFIKDYTGILILDIDKLSPVQLKQISLNANQCQHTYASFISPSGNGFKILVKVNSDKDLHKEAFLKVQVFYETLLNLQIDKSGKDITRLCFFSYDSELYLNEAATVFEVVSKVNLTEYIQPFIQSEIEIQPINNFEVVYQHCVKFTEKKVQYTSGNRNNFVHQLACNLNRKAVPLQVTLGYILADYNFDEKEVTQAVNSAYSNLSEYGKNNATKNLSNKSVNENGEINTVNVDGHFASSPLEKELEDDAPKPTIIDKLETFLSSKYAFRHNIVSGKLEFQAIKRNHVDSPLGVRGKVWKVMNDFIENSMLRECLKARIKTNPSSLRSLLYSDFCQLYNPFEDYFKTLPQFDLQTDYITQLANTITTTKQDLWKQCFKKWLVAMVGCVLNDKVINHTVIVFSGKQGLGKTTWVEKLVPKQLKEYLFSGTINPNNKDTLVQLAECMLINLDELENLNRSEIGSLKEIITKTQIRMRKAYGHNSETMPRRASFAGSVNTAQFLNDTTGSRRFLCFEVEGIQYQHDVDINLVYAQALHLFNDGFRYWFDQEEIKSISENNEQYQLRSPEEELLLTWFEPVFRDENNNYYSFRDVNKTLPLLGGAGGGLSFLNASQIASKLAEKSKITLNDGTINKLGKALKKHNFLRLKKNGIFVYAVNENSWDKVEQKNKQSIKEEDDTQTPPKPPEQGGLPF
jgi:hypothetical protein